MKIQAVAERPSALPTLVAGQDHRAMREMLALVSPNVGPVLRAASFLGSGAAGGGGYAAHAELLDLDGLLRDLYQQPSMEPGVNDTIFGGGKGFRFDATVLSTLGEAAERVVAALMCGTPDLPGLRILGSWSELDASGLNARHPSTVRLFSDAQYDSPSFLYERFETDSIIQWVAGRHLRSGEEVYVPAQLVDMVHIYDVGEQIVGYPVSGGLSCHTSETAATYHGLTEVIERDAVNVSWYTADHPLRVKLDDDARKLLGSFADRLTLDHSEAHVLMHPSAVSSAATISMVGLQGWLRRRAYCAGGGCDAVLETAIRKAAVEFGQTRSTLAISVSAPRSAVGMNVERMFDWEPDRPLVDMQLFFQAIGYYGLVEHRHLLAHYLSGPEVTIEELRDTARSAPEASTDARLEHLLDELAEHEIDPIVLDYSHPDWNALSIVKLYVPELTTPFLQSRPMLGHPRLSPLRDDVIDEDGTILPLPYP